MATIVNKSNVDIWIVHSLSDDSGGGPGIKAGSKGQGAVAHRLAPGCRSPEGVDADGYSENPHDGWVKVRGNITVTVSGASRDLSDNRAEFWLQSQRIYEVGRDEFGPLSNMDFYNKHDWGVPDNLDAALRKRREALARLVAVAVIVGAPIGVRYLLSQNKKKSNSSQQTPSGFNWDQRFNTGYYILRMFGKHTGSGWDALDHYRLCSRMPEGRCCSKAPGYRLVLSGGSGGTFYYHAHLVSGPHFTPRAVCQAAKGLPLPPGHSWTAGWGPLDPFFGQDDCPR